MKTNNPNEFDLNKTKFFVFDINFKIKQTGYVDYDTAYTKCKELNDAIGKTAYMIGTSREDRKIKNRDLIPDPTKKLEGYESEDMRRTPGTPEIPNED